MKSVIIVVNNATPKKALNCVKYLESLGYKRNRYYDRGEYKTATYDMYFPYVEDKCNNLLFKTMLGTIYASLPSYTLHSLEHVKKYYTGYTVLNYEDIFKNQMDIE